MTSPGSPSRFSRSQRWLMMGVVTVLMAAIAATLGVVMGENSRKASQSSTTSTSPFESNSISYDLVRPVHILVMGTDPVVNVNPSEESGDRFSGRSDTMLLVRFDPSANAVNVLSIPRDTQVKIPGVGWGKINEANYWGGVELAIETVQDTLNQVPIDRYIRISQEAFQELVDVLGGVDIFIPQAMTYTDQTQQLRINLSPGWQTLTGEQAKQFARFRSDGQGDFGRVQRQQILVDAIQKRLKQPTVLVRLPQLIRVLQKYVDTNLTFEELLTLARLGLNLEPNQLKMVILPGEAGDLAREQTSYWYVDEFERDRILYQYFKQNSKRYLLETLVEETQDQDFPFNLKIAIQNASNRPNLEQQVLDDLIQQGFYNAYIVPDWPDEYQKTQIIVQQGNLKSAEFLQNLLDLGTIQPNSTGIMGSDLTLRIGQDWSISIRP